MHRILLIFRWNPSIKDNNRIRPDEGHCYICVLPKLCRTYYTFLYIPILLEGTGGNGEEKRPFSIFVDAFPISPLLKKLINLKFINRLF